MFYEYLDFPRMPIELEKLCLDFDNLTPSQYWSRPTNLDDYLGKDKSCFASYSQYMVPKEVLLWLREHNIITKDIRAAKIHCMSNGSRIPAHIDYFRIFAINYLLTDSEATTCFYKHKDLNFVSEKNNVISFDNIELTESVVFDTHRWHRLNVSFIHNVENITTPRVAITLSPWGKCN